MNLGDISENFSRDEFACRCGCGFDTVDVELIRVLQKDIREYFNRRVTVFSGCRCFPHNVSIGGARNSLHIEGKAADFIVEMTNPITVYTYLDTKYPDMYGIGLYPNRVHFDVRKERARWKVI